MKLSKSDLLREALKEADKYDQGHPGKASNIARFRACAAEFEGWINRFGWDYMISVQHKNEFRPQGLNEKPDYRMHFIEVDIEGVRVYPAEVE